MTSHQTRSKEKDAQTPDCAATKGTLVTTPEGEEVCAKFNMGTGEVSYEAPAACTCKNRPEKKKDES